MAIKAGVIFTGVRAALNDQEDAVYHDSVILEYFQMAYEKLRQEMEDSNVPITNITSDAITITAGVTDIGGPTGPALPNDLIEIINLWEVSADTDQDYMLMRRLQFLPKTPIQTAYLEVYSWQDQQVKLLGATGDIQVKFDYVASNLGDVTDKNSQIRLTGAVNYLKFGTAALIAALIEGDLERAGTLGQLASDALDTTLNIKIKNQQSITTRRRPFRASYRTRVGRR